MESEIRHHFGGCKHLGCLCNPKNNPFVEVADREAFIYDDDKDEKEQPCKLVSRESKHQIVVVNKTDKPFVFVKFDACLVRDDNKKCDALVYTDKNFYFVEIKSTTLKGRSKARKKALDQLENSILRFVDVDFDGRAKFAIIGFAHLQPRIVETSSNTRKALFMEKYGVRLMEGQTIPLD